MKIITKQIRAERRKEAEQRQAEYDKLTIREKMARLPIGGAKKQFQRLVEEHLKFLHSDP